MKDVLAQARTQVQAKEEELQSALQSLSERHKIEIDQWRSQVSQAKEVAADAEADMRETLEKLKRDHVADLEQARREAKQSALEHATVSQLEQASNKQVLFEIRELSIDNENQKRIVAERDH